MVTNPVLAKGKRGLENASLGVEIPAVCLQRHLSLVKGSAFRLGFCSGKSLFAKMVKKQELKIVRISELKSLQMLIKVYA